jgi:choline-sulfatase
LSDAFDTGFEPGAMKNDHWTKPDITSLFRRPTILRANEREMIDGTSRTERNSDAKHASRCLEFLKKDVPALGKPWTAYVGFHMPHPRFDGLKRHYDMYMEKGVDMPQAPPDYLENLHPVYDALRHFKRIATPLPEERIRRARAAYYAMITELDEYVGRLYDALVETGQIGNTLFVYTSDHGESLGENGLWLKNNLQEGAARVPLLMAGAGVPRGVRVETPVGQADVAATLLEFGGLGLPSELRGHSLVPLMNGQSAGHPGFAYSECHSEGNVTGSFMVRKGDWKYIHFTWYGGLLHNLREDPCERVNRIDDPRCADILAELKAILERQVDPEEVTVRAFQTQENILQNLCIAKSDAELLEIFVRRLGEGQSRALISKLRGK